MRKFKLEFGYKDKVNQVVTESYVTGFSSMALVHDLMIGNYWWAAFDAAATVLFFFWTKKAAKELRGE